MLNKSQTVVPVADGRPSEKTTGYKASEEEEEEEEKEETKGKCTDGLAPRELAQNP
jgi:hypothetical protein